MKSSRAGLNWQGVKVIKLFWRKSRFSQNWEFEKQFWCSGACTGTKMCKTMPFWRKHSVYSKTLYCWKIAYFSCYSLGRNLEFLQKSFITLATVISRHGTVTYLYPRMQRRALSIDLSNFCSNFLLQPDIRPFLREGRPCRGSRHHHKRSIEDRPLETQNILIIGQKYYFLLT